LVAAWLSVCHYSRYCIETVKLL